jgi:putative oxidoreductase
MNAPALIRQALALCQRIPQDAIALLARVSIASVFWLSGQTKVQGFVANPLSGEFHLGLPRLSDSVVDLFRDEYHLPLIDPTLAAVMAATAEHVFPLLLLIGLATRFSALALLGMTAVIQLLVYPGAWPTHGTWAAVLLVLVAQGAGRWSVDGWLGSKTRR